MVGAVGIFSGVILIILDAFLILGVILIILGVPELAFGIFIGKPDMKIIENNRKTVSEAKAELAKKEAELKELTK